MALKGKAPTTETKRLKAMFFGLAGVGKTTAAIQFPRPYLIDTERGAENPQYVKLLQAAGGAVFQTSDFDELVGEVTALLSEKHEYQTLIIDPITVVYSDLLDKAEKKVGTEFGRHYGEADKRMRRLINLLLRVDMNVIVTAHAKTVYGDKLVKLGDTFDGYKKLDYLFDLVIELQKRGSDRVGIVRKSRIETFPDGEVFPFTYNEIASRYGHDPMERTSKPEKLASEDQIKELTKLVDLLKVSGDIVDKWLTKAKAETLSELPADVAAKCIEWCKKQVEVAA